MMGFVTPAILGALILLPTIWWLLRVTPPAPRIVRFPAIRLLRDLVHREETPARTPLWLILMRMVLATLLIVALAGPILRPSALPPGRGPEIIVVDTGWAATNNWAKIKTALLAEIDRDQRAGMTVVLVPTARNATGNPVDALGPMPAAEAKRTAETLEPMPWGADRAEAAQVLNRFDGRSSALWLSDGIAGTGGEALAAAVAGFTAPRVLTPATANLPQLLMPPEVGPDLILKVRRPAVAPTVPLTLVARGEDGRILGEAAGAFNSDDPVAAVRFELPAEVRNQIARIDLAGAHGVGGTVLLDERWRRRPVAILTPAGSERGNVLLNSTYYIQRALQPFAEVRTGDLDTLLKGQPAVLVVTDDADLSGGDRRAIQDWVSKGGLLLRFAGAKLAASDPTARDALLPTELRTGGRSLTGAMSWTEPASLAPFVESSPFYGLDIAKEVTVSRQILAEPGLDLDRKVWARLADGTPLITADKRDAGTVVLVHTSPDPGWSNLSLSGLFPQMLRRIVAFSAGISRAPQHGVLEPYRVLDGEGWLHAPGGAAAAITADRFDGTTPEPQHPPGYYGEADSRRALNLTQTVTTITPLGQMPVRIQSQEYAAPGEVSLAPWFLAAVLLLAAIDTIVALWLGGALPKLPRLGPVAGSVAGLALIFTVLASPSSAEETGPAGKAAQAASQVTLGYVVTGDAATDRISKAGLAGLAHQLILRTSIDHAAPDAVDLERDELSVYPLLYWPISASSQPLSDQAKGKLNRYLSTGGMILIDTKAGAGDGRLNLGKLIQGIDVPTLAPVPPGHVLTKSFYLLDEFPGRVPGGEVWVERDQDARNDGVSSVVVGSADWAGAWAVDATSGQPLFSLSPGGEKQREWSYRFGVNLVMYALTGNYKSDLVHAPFIQQRLGQ
ncbi:MAG TPA: DUF4159 domain-containing protein [Alphaproteobacteria bacterium]|jgi:hypothetical protein|nr:DUF4159 domain-containing protein [Alphaproteobacteria bacterium]